MKPFFKKISISMFASFLAIPVYADTIKVGFPVPLTGEYAPYAEIQGAKCMAEIINNKGGVNGKKFELLVQDTGTDTQTAISLTEKFLDQGVVAIGTIPFSDTMIPVAQIAAGYGVTILQAQSTQVEMHTGIVDNFISNVSPDPFTAAAAAEYALSEGVKNVVLLTSDDGGSWSAKTPLWFGEVIENGGGKVLSKMNFSIPTSDWSPQIAEMKKLSSSPDAVYISSIMPDVGVLVRQMKAAGIDAWVFGSDGLDDPSLDSVADSDKSILDKVAFGTLAPSQPGSAMQEFQAECKALGMPVDGMFPALGADVIFSDKVISMNDKVNKKNKILQFKKFKIDKNLFRYAKKNCIFLHCLPRGNEVDDEIFLGKKSHVWQQALNRVHVQKSILLYSFGKLR